MGTSSNGQPNRREFIRVKMQIEFCISPLGSYDSMTSDDDCCSFITKTIDVSLGGVCLRHGGRLKVGDAVELRTKNSLTSTKCLTCKDVIFMDNTHQLRPIEADVVWATEEYAGIQFRPLSAYNENILSKTVWDHHIKNIRDDGRKD